MPARPRAWSFMGASRFVIFGGRSAATQPPRPHLMRMPKKCQSAAPQPILAHFPEMTCLFTTRESARGLLRCRMRGGGPLFFAIRLGRLRQRLVGHTYKGIRIV